MTGDQLRAVRLQLGLPCADFARLIGNPDRRTLRRWEAGEVPVPATVGAFLEVFNMLPKREQESYIARRLAKS